MGLRHRTPMSALREQRRCAEQGHSVSLPSSMPAFPRRAGRLHITALDPGNEPNRLTWSVGPLEAPPVPEKCQKLLARLRSYLKPQDDAERLASQAVSSEYRSIQDELQRLAHHTSQQRQALVAETPESESWRELLIPRSFQRQDAANELPYHSIKIDIALSQDLPRIPSLDRSPDDLSYLQKSPSSSLTHPTAVLTLVPKAPHPVENTKVTLLIDDPQVDPEIGAEAANLMQQNLHFARSRVPTVSIPCDVIMSLLND